MNRFSVSFKYYIGQEIYYLYKNYPKRGIIREVNISIKDMNEYRNTVTPIITYKINDNWFNESQLWDDRKQFQKWIDENLCYTKYIDHIENTCDFENKTVQLISIIERTNNKHFWKKKKLAEIFYLDEDNKGYFRYVLFEDISNIRYESSYINSKYDLIKYCGENYIEDDYYNFVNYNGIKF